MLRLVLSLFVLFSLSLVTLGQSNILVSFLDPSTCGGADGSITFSNLQPNTQYTISYELNGTQVPSMTIVSDGNGDYILAGLSQGVYDNITISGFTTNLVPNPSFETVNCQTAFFFPFGCPIDNNLQWTEATQGSTDSYNVCHTGNFGSNEVPSNFSGSQLPNSGDGYAGVITWEGVGTSDYREYIQAKLSSPLTAGVSYTLSFYCSLGDSAQRASDGLGMYLSGTPVNSGLQTVLNFTPQLVAGLITDDANWTLVSGNFTALGGEEYITIGNFYDDASTTTTPTGVGSFSRAYYYVDDVSVVDSNWIYQSSITLSDPTFSIDAGPDLVICEGDSVTLTASPAGSTFSWNNGVIDGVPFAPQLSDTYVVTSTLNGCNSVDSLTVTVNFVPMVSFIGDSLSGCSPVEVYFENTTVGAQDSCVWDFGDGFTVNGCGNMTHVYQDPGLYSVTLSSYANGCVGTAVNTNYIEVYSVPEASFFTSNTSYAVGSLIQFQNTSVGADAFVWEFGEGSNTSSEENPGYTYLEGSGTYIVQLTAYSQEGCTDIAISSIQIQEELIFYVPNSFTPDNDEFNQTFSPIFTSGIDLSDFQLTIYNRWGELLFESYDSSVGWDGTYNGKIMQDGMYTWRVEFQEIMSDKRHTYLGHVSLIE